jgi:hypothetical protein
MPMKPAKPITFNRTSSQGGIGAHLFGKHNPKGRYSFPHASTGSQAYPHGSRRHADEMKTPPAPEDTDGSFMLSPLARLLHLD